MAKNKPFKADIVTYLYEGIIPTQDWSELKHEPTYSNGLRMGGVKLLLDGSPQRTYSSFDSFSIKLDHYCNLVYY